MEGYSLNSYVYALDKYARAIPNTFYIGLVSLASVIFLAVLISYLAVRRANPLNKTIDICSMLPYIMPGSVVGIALIIRRIPYTIRSSIAPLQQIPLSVEEASISLGTSKMKTFFVITVPMMANGILSGAILSWITIMTELSTGIILYTNKTMIMTMAIYNFVSRTSYGYAAAFSSILTLTTILSLLLFLKISRNKEITF